MRLGSCFAVIVAVALSACVGVPALNTETISSTPASKNGIAKVRRFASICSRFPNRDAVFQGFQAMGHPSGQIHIVLDNGKELVGGRSVQFDDGEVIVSVNEEQCFIGLRSMTPDQSFALAKIWATHFDLITNAEAGDGLSDRVVQAWRAKTYPGVQILVAAHKTWPNQGSPWPKEPGAAITLRYRN